MDIARQLNDEVVEPASWLNILIGISETLVVVVATAGVMRIAGILIFKLSQAVTIISGS